MSEVRETEEKDIANSEEESSDISSQTVEKNMPRQGRSNTPLDELEKGLRGLDTAEEDIAELLANNWQRVAGILALCLIGVWLFNQYKIASLQRHYSASDSFSNVQEAYDQLANSADETTATTNRNLLNENLISLRSADDSSILSLLAELYSAEVLVLDGKYDEANKKLTSIIDSGKQVDDKTDKQAVVGELATIVLARSYIKQEKIPAARTALFELLSNGGSTSVEAAVILATLVSTEEEKQQLADAAKNASASHPVIADELSTELKRFGISTDSE